MPFVPPSLDDEENKFVPPSVDDEEVYDEDAGIPLSSPREARRYEILSEMAAERGRGDAAAAEADDLARQEANIRAFSNPFTTIVNAPGRLMAASAGVEDFYDPIYKKQQLINLPIQEGEGALWGAHRFLSKTINSLSDPDEMMKLPAFSGGVVPKALGFVPMAKELPEQVEHAATVAGDIKSTPGEVTEAALDPVANAAMLAVGSHTRALKPGQPGYVGPVPEYPGLPDPDLVARNIASPGTMRPNEIQTMGLPEAAKPPMFEAGNVPFNGMRRFSGPLPPVDVLPRSGRLPPVEILDELRTKEELSGAGKESFAAEAPRLNREALPVTERQLAEAVTAAEDVGLTRSAEAAAASYRAPKEFTAERAAAQERKAAKASVEEGLTMPQPEFKELPPEEGQFPPPVGMPTGTLSKLQRSRILAGKENVRTNVRNNPPGEPNAEGIRGNEGQPAEGGPVNEGGEANRGSDVQQAPPGEPQPVEQGAAPAPEVPQVRDFSEVKSTRDASNFGADNANPEGVAKLERIKADLDAQLAEIKADPNMSPMDKLNARANIVSGPGHFIKEALTIAKREGGDRAEVLDMLRKDRPDYFKDDPAPGLEGAPAEKGIAEKAKDLADRLRENLKSPLSQKELGTFGIIPQIINAAVEIAARVIEKGGTVAEALGEALEHIRKNHKGYFDEAAVSAAITRGVGRPARRRAAAVPAPAPAPAAPAAPAPAPAAPPAPPGIVSRTGTRIANAFHAVSDYITINPIPALTRHLGGDNSAAVQHASARVAIPRIVDDLLAKVFPDQYKNPEAMRATMDIINKDNILGGYDEFLNRAAEALRTGDVRTASKWQGMARDVAASHDLAALARDVEAARADPTISGNIDRWKSVVNPELDQLYNEMKGMDAATPREGRGRVFGARVNLLSAAEEGKWIEALNDEQKPMPSPSSSSYRNPNVKRDKFDRSAKFTGQYSDNPAAVLANVVSPRWNEVTKTRFYNDLVAKGVASWEKPADGTIKGREAKPLPVQVPETRTTMEGETAVDSGTRQVSRTLWVPENAVGDIRAILDTDLTKSQNPIAKGFTAVQLAQIADAATHTKNLHSVITSAQGTKSLWSDVAKKLPILSSGDAAVRITKVIHEISQDTPAIRAEMAEMAKNGMLRQHFPATGLQKITKMQDMIHHVDTAARVIMNRFYDNLVERNLAKPDMASRRAFVQQVGEYNKRLMSDSMRWMSRKGFSPFVVAGRNFNRFGKRLLTGDPGFEAANTKAAIQSRLVNLATLGSIFVLPMMVNYVTTGNIRGRKGTPYGAIDLNQAEDEKGSHKVLDLASLYGVRRGMRATGVESIVEGLENGRNPSEIVDNAISSVATTAAHPWMGPAAGATFQILTGKRLDLRGGVTPIEARKVGEGESQYAENARVTLKNQNPMIYAPLRPLFGDTEESIGKDIGKDFLKAPISAAGVRDVKTPAMMEAQKLAASGEQMTKESASRYRVKRDLSREFRESKFGPESIAHAAEMRKDGKIDKAALTIAMKRADMTPLQFMVHQYLSAPESIRIYKLASEQERATIREEIHKKVKANRTMSPEDTDAAMKLLYPELTR